MFRRLATLSLAAAAIAPAAAHADGLPVPVDGAQHAVTSADGTTRFAVRRAHGDTRVLRLDADRHVTGSATLHGRYAIPVVALDGTAGGLSHDGGTLALIRPRHGFPRARTPLAFLDTAAMRLRRAVTLRGDFSFDALSPDGSTAYLIQYPSPRDATRYSVRSLDPASGRLAPDAIVDPDDKPGEMRGYPLTRVMSHDGAWAYTLYQGGSGHPFVHALDTAHRRAVCIDLPAFTSGYGPERLRLSGDGATLTVLGSRKPYALIDTASFAVRKPGAPRPAPASQQAPAGRGGGATWPGIAAIAAAALALPALALVLVRRRRRPAAPPVSSGA
ncbi:MAG: hypothetical protein QOG63_982 [Thermoleophilaceae bacterium]|nr:hypothetical protein [Thermoleophilaceae bacterium]